jgi:SAM-dependent methyltransferase
VKWLYEFIYRYEIPAWDLGPRRELVDLVENGRIQPSRVIILGSGTANNAIFLAQKGFDVTGVDYAKNAIELGNKRAQKAGVQINFLQDDLTNLLHVKGTFDLLVDFGTLDDLSSEDRGLYMNNVLPLTHSNSLFFLWCFEWPPRWWEKYYPFPMFLEPGEVEARFGQWFEIECIEATKDPDLKKFQPASATYLMTRKPS